MDPEPSGIKYSRTELCDGICKRTSCEEPWGDPMGEVGWTTLLIRETQLAGHTDSLFNCFIVSLFNGLDDGSAEILMSEIRISFDGLNTLISSISKLRAVKIRRMRMVM